MKDKILHYNKIALYILIIVSTLLFIIPVVDNDVWFMINHGDYIIHHGFTNVEPFTVHEGLKFSFQKWLMCVLMYALNNAFGVKGIIGYIYVMCSLILVAFIINVKASKTTSFNVVDALMVAVPCATLFVRFGSARPQLFSYLAIVITLMLLETYAKTGKTQYLVMLPFVSILWMQIHSTQWIFMFALFLAYVAKMPKGLIKCVEVREYSRVKVLITAALSFAVGLINPYGVESVTYIFKSMKDTRYMINIIECQRPQMRELIFLIPLIIFLMAVIAFSKKIDFQHLMLFFGTLMMSFMARRNVAYFIVVVGFILPYLYKGNDTKGIKKRVMQYMTIPLCIAIFVLDAGLFMEKKTIDVFRNTYCKGIVDALDEQGEVEGKRFFTIFDYGSYIEYLGGIPYEDSRAELFCDEINGKEDIFLEEQAFMQGVLTLTDLQNKYHFDYALMRNEIMSDTLKAEFTVYEKMGLIKLIDSDKNCILYKLDF